MLEIMVLHLYVICARLLFQTPKTKSEGRGSFYSYKRSGNIKLLPV